MFKGIQTSFLILAVSGFSMSAFADEDRVSQEVRRCTNTRDAVVKKNEISREEVGDPVTSDGKTVQKMRACYKIECYYDSGNVGTVNTDNMDETFGRLESEEVDRGYQSMAWDSNACKTWEKTVISTERDILDEGDSDGRGNGSGDGNASGNGRVSGKYTLKFGGKVYLCNPGEDYADCLERHGIDATGISFTVSGRDSDGFRIVLGARGPKVDGHADVTGSMRGEISGACVEKDECTWYQEAFTLGFCEDEYILKTECIGAGIGTSGGVDYVVGGDVDLGRVGARGRAGRGWYVRVNGRDFMCSSSEDEDRCLARLRASGQISGGVDIQNCASCGNSWAAYAHAQGNSWQGILSGTAQVLGATIPSIMMYKGMKAQANAHLGAQEAKWGAVATGFEQCQIMQSNFLDSTYASMASNEAPWQQLTVPECNGYGIGQYANNQGWGNNGWGSWGNTWGSAGYSNGFQAAMYGPYGNYNLGNVTGMWGNPQAGLQMNGNFNLGQLLGLPNIAINGGWNGNGAWNNGWNGGWNNGVNANSNWGWNNGWNNNSWRTPGWNPNANLQFNANFNNGWNNNQYSAWGPNQWSASANGLAPWNNQNTSYWNNNSTNGNNWWRVNNSFQSNAQASAQGSYYQQMALQNQANNAYNNMINYNGYNAAYSPMNMGANINAQWGFNFR